MCGFVGVLGPDRTAAETAARRALAALRHRGPDDYGHVTVPLGSQWLSVVHARLAIIDLTESGRQPMVRGALPPSARATRVRGDAVRGDDAAGLVMNGEIYNHVELRQELERDSPPQPFLSRCDTEAVLHGMARQGIEYVRQLRGMFALALWEPATARLHLVRDRLGIKPLYYAQPGQHLVFGSEVRALLATGLVARSLDPVGLEGFLAFGAVQGPSTLVEGVRSLEPSHSLTVEHGRVRAPRRYWQLPTTVNRHITRPEAAEETRRLLREVVDGHLLSDVRVGAFLSGGVDSSVIVALMAEAGRGPQHAITVVSDDGEAESQSEAPYAALVAQRYGVQHHIVHLSAISATTSAMKAVEAMDQPSVDGANTFVVSGAAREAGCAVALSGLGADELFNGYRSFQTLPLWEPFARIAGVSSAGRVLRALVPASSVRGAKLAEMLASGGELGRLTALQRTLFLPGLRAGLVRPAFRAPAGIDVAPRLAPEETPDDVRNLISAYELRGYLQNMLLRDSDVMSMAHGLELRVPFLDHKLVEFALSLPGTFKSNLVHRKSLLIESMKSRLPREVYARRKMGFNLALPLWMRTSLRPRLEAALGRESPVLDSAVIAGLWRSFLGGEKRLGSRLWALYNLATWLDRNLFDVKPLATAADGILEAAPGRPSAAVALG